MRKFRHRRLVRTDFIALAAVLMFSLGAGSLLAAQKSSGDSESLRAVALLFRHGVISPKYDPPKIKTDWPMGMKQLTAIGRRDMYERGKALRQRYVERVGLISGTYDPSEVYVRSSATDRALQSAQYLLLGLFAPGSGSESGSGSGSGAADAKRSFDGPMTIDPAIVRIPINYVPLEKESLLRPWTGKANCKKYRKFVKSLQHTELYREQGKRHQDFLKRIAAVTGMNEGAPSAKMLYEVNEIYEPLSARVRHGLPLPEGISEADFRRLRDLSDWNYHYQFLGPAVGRLTGGTFLGEMVANFSAFAEGAETARKLYLYSGHQRTLLGLEAALGIETARVEGPLFSGRVPPLSSHYAFELHETAPGAYAVRLRFVATDGARTIDIPGCGTATCPLERFAEIASKVTPKKWRKECNG